MKMHTPPLALIHSRKFKITEYDSRLVCQRRRGSRDKQSDYIVYAIESIEYIKAMINQRQEKEEICSQLYFVSNKKRDAMIY